MAAISSGLDEKFRRFQEQFPIRVDSAGKYHKSGSSSTACYLAAIEILSKAPPPSTLTTPIMNQFVHMFKITIIYDAEAEGTERALIERFRVQFSNTLCQHPEIAEYIQKNWTE
jgi:hypothetical protein